MGDEFIKYLTLLWFADGDRYEYVLMILMNSSSRLKDVSDFSLKLLILVLGRGSLFMSTRKLF